MHPPQKLQPLRSGPFPSKYGSGTVFSGSPKNTATLVGSKADSLPICFASVWSVLSPFSRRGQVTVPSIFDARG